MYYRQRVKLEDIRISSEGAPAAEVELRYKEQPFVGRSGGEEGREVEETRLVAEATFAAAERLVGHEMSFRLDTVQALHARENHIVLLTAVMRASEHTVPLIGTCRIVEDNLRLATARAALDAINRFIDLHLADKGFDEASRPSD